MKKDFMKYLVFLFGVFLSVYALASPTLPTIPLNQYLKALYYSKAGEQTGCVLRIDGETGDSLWINVLVSVSMKESGTLFGVFKLIVKKITMRNGESLIQDGKVMYSSIGEIHKGWIKTNSVAQLLVTKDGEYFHNDGYMASMEFYKAMELLIAIPQTNFRVGFSKKEDRSEKVFEFNKRITQDEADKLTSCMKNLNDAREEKSKTSL
jgi:hypothetical protein